MTADTHRKTFMKLKDQTRYYYLKTTKPGNLGLHPFGCMALVVKDGKIYRGVSICSPRDQFSKKEAKRIAEQNARFLEHLDTFAKEDCESVGKSGGCIAQVNGIAGGKTLKRALMDISVSYGVHLLSFDCRFYSKARKETWDSLTEMERHIFISNADGSDGQ